jgi:hypothetical protein
MDEIQSFLVALDAAPVVSAFTAEREMMLVAPSAEPAVGVTLSRGGFATSTVIRYAHDRPLGSMMSSMSLVTLAATLGDGIASIVTQVMMAPLGWG